MHLLHLNKLEMLPLVTHYHLFMYACLTVIFFIYKHLKVTFLFKATPKICCIYQSFFYVDNDDFIYEIYHFEHFFLNIIDFYITF